MRRRHTVRQTDHTTKHNDRIRMAKHHGRLELTWTDKEKALLSTGEGRYDYTFVGPSDYRVSEVRLLHEVECIEVAAPADRLDHLPIPSTDNLLITGDAMHVLDALAKIPEYADKYLGKVKLVYIDPPFNTGQVFANYEDNIEHSIWLTMLRDRLLQIKPLLADDGCVWVHLDHVESHRCRVVLDEVFGIGNFVAEVAWQKADNTRSNNVGFSTSHDSILVYRKTGKWVPNRMQRAAALDVKYTSPDGDPRRWFDGPTTVRGDQKHHDYIHAIQHPITGELIYPTRGRHWAKPRDWILEQMSEYAPYELRDLDDAPRRAEVCGVAVEKIRPVVEAVVLAAPLAEAEEKARARYENGNWPDIVLRSGGGGGIGFKLRIPEGGSVPTTWWTHEEVGSNRTAKSEIKALFPTEHAFATPKPERLLQRIIHIATDPGDIVLDCFAGSGTTAAVAHKMCRRWVTSEMLSGTVTRYTRPRLIRVVRGDDSGGVTTATERVPFTNKDGDEVVLPEGLLPEKAQEFNGMLSKVCKHLAEQGAELDATTIATLRTGTKTRDERWTMWNGGGGFTHLEVDPSMFTEVAGMVLLADWATHGALARAMCAQIGVRYRPYGIFAAKRGRTRYVVVDGMVGESTVASILDRLAVGEIVEVWATQIEDGALDALKRARPGSRLELIPDAVLDKYRRNAASRPPFGKGANAAKDAEGRTSDG
jgi:adenine-specific DNA-methyltransferase